MLIDINKKNSFDSNYLEISYWDKNGFVVIKKKYIHKNDLFNWVQSDRKTDQLDYLGRYVKKSPVKSIRYLTQERTTDLIEQYFSDDIDEIYSYNLPTITFFDIETTVSGRQFVDVEKAEEKITTISFVTNNKLFVLGWKPMTDKEFKDAEELIVNHLNNSSCKDKYIFKYKCFATESDMLIWFVENVVKRTGLLTGWNSNKFDWPYICYRCKKLNIIEAISKGIFRKAQDGMLKGVHINHTMQFDYLIAFMTWARKVLVDNYRLDTVGEVVAGIKKIEHKESFMELYNNNYAKYVAYNAIDSVVVQQIHIKTRALSNGISMSPLTRSKASDSATRSILVSDAIRYYYKKEGRVIPVLKEKHKKESSYEGAFFKKPVLGKHWFCMSCDYASLYPNIMREFNISPETFAYMEPRSNFIKPIKEGYIRCASGAVYRKEEGTIPRMLKDLYYTRKSYKKVMEKYKQAHETGEKLLEENVSVQEMVEFYNSIAEGEKKTDITRDEFQKFVDSLYLEMKANDDKQWAAKTIINATYGAFGFEGFRFFDINIAESITVQGKDCILYTESHLNDMFKNQWHLLTDVHKKMNINVTKKVEKNSSVYIATDSIYFSIEDVIKSSDWMQYDVWCVYMNGYNLYCSARNIDTEEQAKEFFTKVQGENIDGYREIKREKADECYFAMCLYRNCLEEFFKNVLSEYADKYNTNGKFLDFEFESFSRSGIWTGKNRYVQDIRWSDPNIFYLPYSKIKSTGLEDIKSTYPKFLRKLYEKTLLYCLQLDKITEANIIGHLNEMKRLFMQAPIKDICELASLNTYSKYVVDDTNSVSIMSKTPQAVKAAALWNYLVKKKNTDYSEIQDGDKVRIAIIKKSKNHSVKISENKKEDEVIDVIAFAQDTDVNERVLMNLGITIDRNAMFEKLYLGGINRILSSCGCTTFDSTLVYEQSLFL